MLYQSVSLCCFVRHVISSDTYLHQTCRRRKSEREFTTLSVLFKSVGRTASSIDTSAGVFRPPAMSEAHNSCAISWCKGHSPFVQIPQGPSGNAVLRHSPFNYTPKDLQERGELSICSAHLQAYQRGRVNGVFKLHEPRNDPIYRRAANGEIGYEPQPGFLFRTGWTPEQFCADIAQKIARGKFL